MKKNIIIHIPHSSLFLPKEFLERVLVSKDEIEKENIFVSDYLVDKLIPTNFKNVLKFNYSRLFCDIERFQDDNLEEMAKKGMGVVYEKNSKGEKFISFNDDYKNQIIKKYYLPFHNLIDKKTMEILNQYQTAYFLDFHSFSDEFVYKVLNLKDNPDICLGVCDDFLDGEFLEFTKTFFEKYNYKVKVNYPYSGTLIPNIVLKNNDKRLKPLMIEINKRLYLDNNEKLNEIKFQRLKKIITEYLNNI